MVKLLLSNRSTDIAFNDEELTSVLNEIENILDTSSFDDCIIGGDFNFDSTRSSGYANTMRDFLSRLVIVSVSH